MPSFAEMTGQVHTDTGLMLMVILGVTHMSGLMNAGLFERFSVVRGPVEFASVLTILGLVTWLTFDYSLGHLV